MNGVCKVKFLVIGLGSMGKRRVRNLIALDCDNIAGFDIRPDRRKYSNSEYNIVTFKSLESAINKFNPDVFIISTPPEFHMEYANFAFDRKIHCFIEGSVVDADKILELSQKNKGTDNHEKKQITTFHHYCSSPYPTKHVSTIFYLFLIFTPSISQSFRVCRNGNYPCG